MSLHFQQIIAAGNLTRDPALRFLPRGNQAVCNFGLAINRRWKGADGELREEVTFLDVEAWGKVAEFAGQWLTKGTPAFVTGRLRMDQWTDKDGLRRSRVVIVADTVQFVESKREGKSNVGPEGGTAADPALAVTGAEPAGDIDPFTGEPVNPDAARSAAAAARTAAAVEPDGQPF